MKPWQNKIFDKPVRLNVVLETSERVELARVAKREGRPASHIARAAIVAYLQRKVGR